MIDLNAESAISLRQAAKLFPPTRRDKPVHVSTVLRWVLRGVDGGVRLEAVRLGKQWVTTKEAISRFSVSLTAKYVTADDQPAAPERSGASPRASAAWQDRQDAAERRLVAMGVN